jgi:hypothetical protein
MFDQAPVSQMALTCDVRHDSDGAAICTDELTFGSTLYCRFYPLLD